MSFSDAELIGEFVVESNEHLADIENKFLSIEAAGANIDVELVNTVFRAVHSIKGAAGFLGLKTINGLAHSLENVLNLVRNRQVQPNSQSVEAMLRAADELRRLINNIAESNSVDASTFVAQLDAIGCEGPTDAAVMPPVAATPVVAAAPLTAPSNDPIPAATGNAPISAQPAEPTPAATVTPSRTEPPTVESNIRVSVQVLDRLMNLAGELVLSRNQLNQAVNSPDRANLESVVASMDRVTSELQDAIMCTRMQPIGNVFSCFPRVVRDLAVKLGKQCELTIEGKEVEVDKTIIEAIGDPLTHLVRNSVDHGVEFPDARSAAGKPRCGTVQMKACYQEGKVKIFIKDDGAGMDPKKLRTKAISKGLITAEQAAKMGDREAIRLIFHPGFSTAETISDISGRGVGMDVVRTNIERLGGTVDVESVVGQGTTIHITLPLTLAIIPSMIVNCSGQRYAIPQVNIVELVRVRPDEVSNRIGRLSDAEVLRLRGSLLPLVRLDQTLGMVGITTRSTESDGDGSEIQDAKQIIVVESGPKRYGLIVDRVHDSEEIVVKPLGRHLKSCSCLAGATILGDGYVALILDVFGVANVVRLRGHDASSQNAADPDSELRCSDERQTVLLFNSDPDEQFAVPMSVVSRIERVRALQLSVVGRHTLLQARDSSIPLLQVQDCLTARPGPKLDRFFVVVFRAAGREIGLIAPRLNDIREVPMTLDSTMLSAPGVLGSLVIDGITTRVLNVFEVAEAIHPEWFEERTRSTQEIVKTVRTVLVVEDSAFFRRQLCVLLEKQGYRTVCAEDGQQALDILTKEDEHIDLVLTDVEMPNINGLQLCQRVKKSPSLQHLPVIMLSSLAGDEDQQRGKAAGADDYHIKLDSDALLASLNRSLGGRCSPVRVQRATPMQHVHVEA